MTNSIQWKRDTAANWTSSNRVLLSGEMGFETDTKRFKIGDGATAWNSLVYETSAPPVTLTGATNLTALVHGNRQILFNGANATLTVQNDTNGGWADDAQISVQTVTGSSGLPTISTPDGKTITAPNVTTPIGATRKGANAWDVYLLPSAAGGGSALSTFGPGTAFGYVTAPYNFTTLTALGVAGSALTAGTAGFAAVGTTSYSQINRVTYTGTVNTATTSHVETALCFALGAWRQRIVVNAAANDAMGNTAPFLMGISSVLGAFTTVALQPADSGNGAVIGIGWKGDGSQSNVQLISSPATGGGTYTDLGASFPIPGAAQTAMYQLQLDYYPTSDPGGRRVVWKLTEQITGSTTGGTITTNLIAQATAQSYCVGASRYTTNGTSAAPVLDFGGIYLGATTQWAP